MIDHFSILENSMKELGKILRLNAQYFGLSNENIHQLQPIIQHTQQIYEMTLNQTKSININSLRQLQQSQHLGLCSSKIFVNEDQNFDKNLNKEKLNSFKNKIDFDFSEVDSQSIYLAFLSQIALLNAIENALKILNDKFIFERANWYQNQFIKYVSQFINKICENHYKPSDIAHLIHPILHTTMANFTLFEVHKDQAFLTSLEQLNQGIDLNYGKESQNSDPFLKKFFNI